MGENFFKKTFFVFAFVLFATMCCLLIARGVVNNNEIISLDNAFTGFVAHPLYPGFSAAESGFTFNNNTRALSVSDAAVYKTGYYSINGSQWVSFSLSGTAYGTSPVWLTGTATKTLPYFGVGEHYIIIYSCKYLSASASWNCSDNRWQLKVINNTPAVIPPAANCYDGKKNGDETGIDCGGSCPDACPEGRIFYVAIPSDGGNDNNPGTESRPWATWNKGFNSLSAGDTLYIKGGTYTGMKDSNYGVKISGRIGTASNPIRVLAYDGEPILNCIGLTGSGEHDGIVMEGSSYWYIKGLTVMNVFDSSSGPGPGWTVYGVSHITMEQCTVRDSANGFISYVSDDVKYINCDSYQNHDHVNNGDLANGFYASVNYGQTVSFEGCRSWLNSDDGWDSFISSGSGGGGVITYDNCWAFENGAYADSVGNGCGFKTGATADSSTGEIQRKLTNCLSFDNTGAGFDESQDPGIGNSIQHALYNCVSYHNGVDRNGVGFSFGYGAGKDGSFMPDIFKNCISYDERAYWTLNNNDVVDHNSWQNGLSVSSSDFLSLDSSQAKRQRKADGSLPDMDFLHLAAGSDLIDNGTYVGLDYNGKAPDLGAFEYR
jgi:hypothetical protein